MLGHTLHDLAFYNENAKTLYIGDLFVKTFPLNSGHIVFIEILASGASIISFTWLEYSQFLLRNKIAVLS